MTVSDDLTIPEAALICRVSSSTIKREIASGKLVATRYRGCTRIARGDLEEYRKKCRSVSTEEAMKYAFSTPDVDLAALLRHVPTLNTSKRSSGRGSTTVELAEYRRTRSKKLSTAS